MQIYKFVIQFCCCNELPSDPVLLSELKQNKLYESWYVGFRIMARERMAKLLKYDHFESHTSHIIVNCMIIKITPS